MARKLPLSSVEMNCPLELFTPQHDTLFFNLRTTDPEQLVTEGHPFGWVLRAIQQEDATKEEFAEALKLSVSNLNKLSDEERNQWEKLMYYLMLLIFHRRDIEEQPELISLVNETVKDRKRQEEVSKMGRTAAQALIEEGKEIGIEQGAIRASQDALLKFVTTRFGHVPITLEQKILATQDTNKLNLLIEQVARANDMSDISIE